MTYSALDFDFLEGEALAIDAIPLSRDQIARALHLSQQNPPETQWQTYLNALALFGFEQWLQSRSANLTIQDSGCSLFLPEYANQSAVCQLQVGGFEVCLLPVGVLSDIEVTIPAGVIDHTPAQLYIVVDVQEEQEQVVVKAGLRSDQLIRHQHAAPVQLDADGTYTLPLSWFEADPEEILLYLRCLEPAALPIPTPMPSLTSAPALEEQPIPSSAVSASPTFVLNARLWLRDQLEAIAQDLSWRLMPPPLAFADAMRTRLTLDESPVARFGQLLTELNRQGVEIPPAARGVCRPLEWGESAVMVYAIAWDTTTTTSQEWTLLLALGAQPNTQLPLGLKLQIQDADQVLIEREVTTEGQSGYLYGRVIGSWNEQFSVAIAFTRGVIVTLPPFGFSP